MVLQKGDHTVSSAIRYAPETLSSPWKGRRAPEHPYAARDVPEGRYALRQVRWAASLDFTVPIGCQEAAGGPGERTCGLDQGCPCGWRGAGSAHGLRAVPKHSNMGPGLALGPACAVQVSDGATSFREAPRRLSHPSPRPAPQARQRPTRAQFGLQEAGSPCMGAAVPPARQSTAPAPLPPRSDRAPRAPRGAGAPPASPLPLLHTR